MSFNHKKINFSPWLINELKINYKIIEKSSMSKSFSEVLSVKKNKKINTWLSRNKEIEIILNYFSTIIRIVDKVRQNVTKNETFLIVLFIRG